MIVCIGREFGSGGHEIGLRLAKALNIPFFDKELLDKAISRSTIPPEMLQKSDEKKANPWMHRVWYDSEDKDLRGKPANEILYTLQSRIILEEAAQGNCIFVGRCADDILQKNKIERISLFIAAPEEVRIQRKTELTGKPPKEVTALLRKTDSQRKNYYQHHTGKPWGSICTYDFCINSSIRGIDGTVAFLENILK